MFRNLLPLVIGCAVLLLGSSGLSAASSKPAVGERNGDADSYPADVNGYGTSEQARLLEGALERYRDIERHGGWAAVPTDLVMGPGYSYDCKRIAAFEKRLVVEGYLREEDRTLPPPAPEPTAAEAKAARKQQPPPSSQPRNQPMGLWGPCPYSPALTAAVKAFQVDRSVLGVGQLASRTMTQLNRPVEEIVEILEQDLARWRGVSLDRLGSYLLVDIPFFELVAYENGHETLRMPVVVGKRDWQTPSLHAEVQSILLNPDWGIPEKIAKVEYLPLAARDSGYLRRQGITNDGGSLRQKPGPNNPLGRVKFVMPNPDDIYLHDTPAKGAFDAAVKALSHGCVRLSNAAELASYLLREDSQWSLRRLQAAISSGQTQGISLRRRMPVTIIYSTSRVNEDGRLELRPDVYGKNRMRPIQERDSTDAIDKDVDTGP